MADVTNRIPFEEAADLLSSARACVAFVVDGRPRVEPVVVRYDSPRFLVSLADDSRFVCGASEVSLVIDEGTYFFDLRAISVRGVPSPVDGPTDTRPGWIEFEPTKVTCWDYGRLRATDGHQ